MPRRVVSDRPRGALALALSVAIAFGGCATTGAGTSPAAAPSPDATAPTAPVRTVANFGDELRCMDYLLVDYGARDLTVGVDDKLNAGVKGMLASAVSDMTRRSRAVRLMAYGADGGVTPQYVVRGSVSNSDGLAVDLSLTTQDQAMVPGATARNQVPRGRAELAKFGTRLRLADGESQALRPLVELSAIELVGRLAKVPYWTCFGATDDDPAVAAEIRDWYDGMVARPSEIIEYFQAQMRLRRLYEGPIDGVVNPQIKDAVARYREALGLSHEPKLSQEFLKAYLKANHREVAAKVGPAVAAPAGAAPAAPAAAAPAAPAPASAAPLTVRVAAANDARKFARGEAVQLTVKPSRDAHVYCFLQDENQKISRFFPNRFHRDSRVAAAEGVRLPGAMRFEIRLNARGVPETVSCFATERDVLAELPGGLGAADFDPLPATTLQQLRSGFASVTGGTLGEEVFRVQPK
jgi:hypothetical protein